MIVGITGSVGKTSTKEAVFAVLSAKYRVRRSEKNYNTEIGVPLTILGIPHHGRNVFKWFSALFRVAFRVLFLVDEYPEILVLEMGADRPGDIAYLVKLAPPFVGVVTAIGEIPVHVEFFAGPRELALEKSKLIAALPPEGYAVLNHDDAAILEIKGQTRAHVFSYGFEADAMMRIMNHESRIREQDGRVVGAGTDVTLAHGGKIIVAHLQNSFGKPQAYAAAAAAAVGLVLNMSMPEIAAALGRYESPPGRLKLLRGNKGALILDDTYNASTASTRAGLEVLREFPATRRIAVLGDMLELGKYTEAAHRAVGDAVAKAADLFIAVGERMKCALDEAAHGRMENRRQLPAAACLWFRESRAAGRKLDNLLRPGDVVLVKGSQSMRMERVVEEIMAEPQRAKELLVRQDLEWLGRP